MSRKIKRRGSGATRRQWMLGLAFVASLSGTVNEARGQDFDSPMRIAEGPPGQILVSDSRRGTVVALDEKSLTPAWIFDVEGSPMAVGFAANLILIGNVSTRNVEVYRFKGESRGAGKTLEFQFNLGHTPQGMPGTLQTPSDLDVDKDAGLVFVVDSGARKVKVFDLEGNAVSVFESAEGPQMLSPTAIAVDPTRQEVLVSDYGDPNGSMFSGAAVPARILIYTYGGVFVSQIDGRLASVEAQFERPQGLTVDRDGRIFMAECVRGEVYVFDRTTGAMVKKLGNFGQGPGELNLPLDVVFRSKSGELLVTNSMLGRIEVFADAGGRR